MELLELFLVFLFISLYIIIGFCVYVLFRDEKKLKKFCNKCFYYNKGNAKYCGKCGNKLEIPYLYESGHESTKPGEKSNTIKGHSSKRYKIDYENLDILLEYKKDESLIWVCNNCETENKLENNNCCVCGIIKN